MRSESAESMPGFASESRGRQTGQRTEPRTKRSQAFVSKVKADIRDTFILGQQHFLGFLDPPPRHELMRRLSEGSGEQSIEMKRRKASLARRGFERNAVPEAVPQKIASTEQPRKCGRVAEPDIRLRQLLQPRSRPHI